MDVGKFGPGDRDHFSGGVQLHGTTTKSNHGVTQGKILAFEVVNVTQHLGFRVIRVEDFVLEVRRGTFKLDRVRGGAVLQGSSSDLTDINGSTIFMEDRDQLGNVTFGSGFIQSNTNGVVINDTEVDTFVGSLLKDGRGVTALDGQSIKVSTIVLNDVTRSANTFSQDRGQVVDALSNVFDTLYNLNNPLFNKPFFFLILPILYFLPEDRGRQRT
jgi:hypothetical protein